MSTLAVVEEILRETAVPMSVREIVERAGARLPSKSKTPDTVVARDLSMDIKRKGEASMFVRSSPGRYALRAMHAAELPASQPLASPAAVVSQPQSADGATSLSSALLTERAGAMPARKPVTAAKSEDGFAIER
jgi:restriction system protein